ncbi:aminoacyl-tRNA hydrolase [Sulfidibacter corallicola]|uniref:Aminoacyl-tRNA hydrolase n=1 Tax=Sulfidibacter corallicola TaxID=2818388 RepID=A0A8A4TSM1_SULCO|nr:aminoacyl-tRNA hydrolase [Sulfidibacter corallicola]QTD52959.1 aminoacyl-tRNA hydrolase [Sulfidibacter corallicola]
MIVGLGNPGHSYVWTRHNAGFLWLDRMMARLGAEPQAGSVEYDLWSCEKGQQVIFFMKPLTYMNLSGQAVSSFLRRIPLEREAILIAYDDVALPLGRIRLRPSGSAGGQKGMRHIIETLQTSEIARLRIGIQTPAISQMPLVDYVLERFSEDELAVVGDVFDIAVEAVTAWLDGEQLKDVMSRFNPKAADVSRIEGSRKHEPRLGGEEIE